MYLVFLVMSELGAVELFQDCLVTSKYSSVSWRGGTSHLGVLRVEFWEQLDIIYDRKMTSSSAQRHHQSHSQQVSEAMTVRMGYSPIEERGPYWKVL